MGFFTDYRLIDCGEGRRLERFGPLVLNRLCPAAERLRQANPRAWNRADVRFVAESASKGAESPGHGSETRGHWLPLTEKGRELFFESERVSGVEGGKTIEPLVPKSWTIRSDDPVFCLALKGTPFGHIGVFPEQAENWGRIAEWCREGMARQGRPMRVLNLFAYTGGSSLAAASVEAEVVHLDAARNMVQRAKKNAELSSIPLNRIKFVVEDAIKFVRREQKRGRMYDGIILDPPSYGHGARGEIWQFGRDLPVLLELCFAILTAENPFFLLTAHTAGYEPSHLAEWLKKGAARRFEGENRGKIASGGMRCPGSTRPAFFSGNFALFSIDTLPEPTHRIQ